MIQRDAYTAFLERFDGLTFAHCDVRRWSPRIARDLKADFECLRRLHTEPIHTLHDPTDRKHGKFCAFLGLHVAGSAVGLDGRRWEIVRTN